MQGGELGQRRGEWYRGLSHEGRGSWRRGEVMRVPEWQVPFPLVSRKAAGEASHCPPSFA